MNKQKLYTRIEDKAAQGTLWTILGNDYQLPR